MMQILFNKERARNKFPIYDGSLNSTQLRRNQWGESNTDAGQTGTYRQLVCTTDLEDVVPVKMKRAAKQQIENS